MKSKFLTIAAILLLLTDSPTQAQDAFGEIIKSGQTEANKLASAYLAPLGKGFGVGLNNGWATSPKVYKPGRFEIRLMGSAALVPEEDKSFDLSTLGYNTTSGTVRLNSANSKIAPTMFGANTDGPLLDVYGKRPDTGQDEKLVSFYTPKGLGVKAVPTPMVQATVGLFKETALTVRFMPELTRHDYSASLYGVGLEHNLSQWLPIVRDLPLDLTASVGFTNFNASYLGINVDPEPNVPRTPQQNAAGYYDNQKLGFNTKAYSGSLLAGRGSKVISGFAGLNYSHSVTTADLLGTYPVTSIRETLPYQKFIADVKDPIHVNINHTQIGLTAGFRLKLAIFSLFGQGTLSKYSSATAGIGIGWN